MPSLLYCYLLLFWSFFPTRFPFTQSRLAAASVLLSRFQYDTRCSASNNFTASLKETSDENLSPMCKMGELAMFSKL